MAKQMAVIERFRCAVEFDHTPNEEEIKLINEICEVDTVEEGLRRLRSNAQYLSHDGLTLLASCAA